MADLVEAAPRALGVEGVEGGVHGDPGAHRALGVVGTRIGGAEGDHDGVADELVDGAPVGEDRLDHAGVVGRQERDHLGRRQGLGETREAADVAEHHRHLLSSPAGPEQGLVLGRDALPDAGREVAPELGVGDLEPDRLDHGAARDVGEIAQRRAHGREAEHGYEHELEAQRRPHRRVHEIRRHDSAPILEHVGQQSGMNGDAADGDDDGIEGADRQPVEDDETKRDHGQLGLQHVGRRDRRTAHREVPDHRQGGEDEDVHQAAREPHRADRPAAREQAQKQRDRRQPNRRQGARRELLEQAEADDPMDHHHDQDEGAAHQGQGANAPALALQEQRLRSAWPAHRGHGAPGYPGAGQRATASPTSRAGGAAKSAARAIGRDLSAAGGGLAAALDWSRNANRPAPRSGPEAGAGRAPQPLAARVASLMMWRLPRCQRTLST